MNRTSEIKIPKLLLLVIMAAVLAVGMGMSSVVSFAGTESKDKATPGPYSISGNYGVNPSIVSDLAGTELTLYRVGSFDRDSDGKAIIDLDDNLDEVKLPATKESDGKDKWTNDWLAAASTIEDIIVSNSELESTLKVTTTTTDTEGKYTFSSLNTGVYLITGKSKTVEAEGKTTTYWPQAMLVQILQKNAEANLKPLSGEYRQFKIVKSWAGDDETTRPKSVTMVVTYDGTEVYTFELNADNQWTASWKAKPDQMDASKWAVEEKTDTGSLNYSVSRKTTPDGDTFIYNFTNTYNPPPTDKTLELVKSVPVYLQHADGKTVSTSFTFEITGYLGNDVVYHRYAGMQFDKDGKQTLTITGIPDGLTKVVVKEVPTANYTVTGGAEKEAVLSGDLYKVEFENTYNDTTHYDGGVINKYKQTGGKYVFDFREGIVLK